MVIDALPHSVQGLLRAFRQLQYDAVPALSPFYHPAVRFRDPFVDLQGRLVLLTYFQQSYHGVEQAQFDYDGCWQSDDTIWVRWQLQLRHPRLGRGQVIRLPGVTRWRIEHDQVIEHEDFYDAGALLYEQVPLLGRVVRWLKGRMGQ